MIYIIGAGAVGKPLAVFLSNAGKTVMLVRASVDQLETNQEEIRVSLVDGSEVSAVVSVCTLAEITQKDGLVLVTSKSYGNERSQTV